MIKVKLNDILESKERNLNWLAKKCNISYSTLYNFANNNTTAVSYNVIEAVCDVLEVDISDILQIIKQEEKR
ncbi:helix-turn-helix transcriptional regulator [Clostridium sp. MSJ-11]|uniref:Helix-turn-helix transcriptional regulator n=1 Tax=Clostridium mobile TaxID=2841512 RepID=A0ABS6EL85_9CLOT|nr:helix-turn-helix transcriptional regulator [Clostridium mobile]MBU5485985.1 helix-turn-helix transcriptional regulator [Clostridium mobile]